MNRRALLLVSLGAIVVLVAIGVPLLLTNDSEGNGSSEPAPSTAPDPSAMRFDDPEGTYSLDVDPDWDAAIPTRAVESWRVDTPGDFVSIETATVVDTDLDQYLQRVIEEAPDAVTDFRLREFRVVTAESPTTDGDAPPPQLGIVAYEGVLAGTPRGWYKVASVEDGRAVVATLTTDDTRFDVTRDAVAPYLLTLRPTG